MQPLYRETMADVSFWLTVAGFPAAVAIAAMLYRRLRGLGKRPEFPV